MKGIAMSKTLLKTFNLKTDEVLKMMEELQEDGVNISHLCREAIKKAYNENQLNKAKKEQENDN